MKFFKIFFRHRKQSSQSQSRNLKAFLEDAETRDKVRLSVTIPDSEAESFRKFLSEKGLSQSYGIPLLMQYALSDENEEELEKLRLEKDSKVGRSLYSEYAAMNFQAYEYFMENKRITMKLNLLLSENHSLKKRLEDEGLQNCVFKDEWDDWDKARVDEFFDKYVFVNRH